MGLKLIKARLDQRLGRSPSVAKSTKKQRKGKNVSGAEDSSPEPEVKSKGKRSAPKATKTESKKTGESSGEEQSLTERQNSKAVDSDKEKMKKNAKIEEAKDKAKPESDIKEKIEHSSKEADKQLSNADDDLNLESFLS